MHVPVSSTDRDRFATINADAFEPKVKSKGLRRQTVLNEYMALHYQILMKEEAERRILLANEAWNALTDDEKFVDGKALKKPTPLAIRKETAAKFWEIESEDVKAEVLASIEEKKQKALEDLANSKEPPKTPAQYHL